MMPERSVLFLIFAIMEKISNIVLQNGKSLSKNGSPIAFLIKKADDKYDLFFFINRIKSQIMIDLYETNPPTG